MENKESKDYTGNVENKFDSREFLDHLGFKKTETGWKDDHDLFIFDTNVPSQLRDLVKIISGTAFRKGETKERLKHIK